MDHGSNDIDHLATGLDSLEETDDVDQPGDTQPQKFLAGKVHKLGEVRVFSKDLLFEAGLPHKGCIEHVHQFVVLKEGDTSERDNYVHISVLVQDLG